MGKGYWKLVDEADGWDIHKDKYEWIEEVEEGDDDDYSSKHTVERPTGRYSYVTPKWIKESRGY